MERHVFTSGWKAKVGQAEQRLASLREEFPALLPLSLVLLLVPGVVLLGLKPSLILGSGSDAAPAQAEQAAASTDGAPTEAAPPAAPADISPRFSTVRINSMGEAVITGQANGGTQVTVLADGRPLGASATDAAGHWVLLPADALATGTHELSLIIVSEAGEASTSEDVVRFTVPDLDKLEAQAGLVLDGTALQRVAPAAEAPQAVAAAPASATEDDALSLLPAMTGVGSLDQSMPTSFSERGRLAEPDEAIAMATVSAPAPLQVEALPVLPGTKVASGDGPSASPEELAAMAAPVALVPAAVAAAEPAPRSATPQSIAATGKPAAPQGDGGGQATGAVTIAASASSAPVDVPALQEESVAARPAPAAVDFAAAERTPAGTVRASLADLARLVPKDPDLVPVTVASAGDAARAAVPDAPRPRGRAKPLTEAQAKAAAAAALAAVNGPFETEESQPAKVTTSPRGNTARAFAATVPMDHIALGDIPRPVLGRTSKTERATRASLTTPSKLRLDPSLTKVHVDTIVTAPRGGIYLAGYAGEGARIEVTIGDRRVGETVSDSSGRWKTTVDTAGSGEGTIVVQVRQLADDGSVANSTIVPYRAAKATALGGGAAGGSIPD